MQHLAIIPDGNRRWAAKNKLQAIFGHQTGMEAVRTAIKVCIKNNIKVECLPGATAFVPALVNSGLPINSFCFEGFLPLKKGRQTFFKKKAEEERTMVFYESPVRLVKTLKDFIDYFGAERQCCVSRELTKVFEENKRGTLQEVHDYFNEKNVKGEIVIVVEGKK